MTTRPSEESEHALLLEENNPGLYNDTTDSAEDASVETLDESFDISQVKYALDAFIATAQPVIITMILSSFAVVYIRSPQTASNGGNGLSVYNIDDDDSNVNAKIGESAINALVIVGFMAALTFVVVFLYWMRCMLILKGYMLLSSTLLLGMLGGVFSLEVLDKYQIPFDAFSFFILLWNFAVVGLLAIFYQKGVPVSVTQGYLMVTSVILAWNFSRFDEYTTWALLVALALYDLCAVLTPCGPLKALVGLMQTRREPLPGLLYEADLPMEAVDVRSNIGSGISSTSRGHVPGEAGGSVEMTRTTSIPAPAALGVSMMSRGAGSYYVYMNTFLQTSTCHHVCVYACTYKHTCTHAYKHPNIDTCI
jgi:presenilin 1